MKMKKIKLNNLSARKMSEKQMNVINGGNSCGCSCYYHNRGGSSESSNYSANNESGLYSKHGEIKRETPVTELEPINCKVEI
ncbi:rSAM-modified peptide [Marinilabiliaceae bacterium JC040]|nr:rSAM-modified peptide [Marinilabiliaceae bacterium JC040]